jgi:uncharacterized protein
MTDAHRPWYREPMVWLVIGLPMSSIVAGTSLLTFALITGGADAVPDEVRRMSQIQLSDISADRRAFDRDLRAEIEIDPDTGALALSMSGLDTDTDGSLALMFVHPLRAEDDRTLSLVRAGDRWLGRFDGALDHDWQLSLGPDDRQWRLQGRIAAHRAQATLLPRSGSG